jgi:hypothetical protein
MMNSGLSKRIRVLDGGHWAGTGRYVSNRDATGQTFRIFQDGKQEPELCS